MFNIKQTWDETFLQLIGEEETKTETNPVDWRASGRATKDYPDKENKQWWDDKGPEMVQTFINFWENNRWSIWHTPNGTPAVEIEMNVTFGNVPVKCYADLIAVTPAGELGVVDLKTGASTPESTMQLGVYACAMEILFDIRPSIGFYYSARSGIMEPVNIDQWTIPILSDLFNQFKKGLDNEIFLPNMGMTCKSCSVKEYCYSMGGQLSHNFDPLSHIK
jgi:hypothetical protein